MIGRRKLVGNSLSILVNRLTQSLTTFVQVAFIARILGPYELGQYLLAFSYYFIFMTIASEGLKTLFTRDIARNPPETPVYLVSGTFLQFLFSIVGYVLLVIVVFVLPYKSDTSTVCYILGLTIIPFSLSNITEAIFQGREKMHLIAISTVPIYILRVLVMIWAMKLNYGVSFLAGIMVFSEFAILLVEWCLIIRLVKPKWQINRDFIWRTVKSARTFVAIEGVAAFNGRIQLLILSVLGGEVVVGLYGGISQLMQPFQIVAQSLVIAVFPGMSKAVALGREKQRQMVETIAEMLLIVALPLIVALFFIGGDLLIFIYRDPSFAKATVALNVLALTLITSSFSRPLSFLLVANGFEWVNLREVIIATVVGSLLSVVLISQYQLTGASLAVLLTSSLGFSQFMYSVYIRLFSLRLVRIMRRPLLISTLMLIVFLILQKISQNLLLTLIAASFAYGLIGSILSIHALGGPTVVWAKLLRKERSS
jgi:O-antigen/teichoic acid export membrane protein